MTKLLSICIPTYNRSRFLAWTLRKTLADFPDAEILVSDNDSTDDSWGLSWAPSSLARAQWIRQPTNIGAFNNMREVLLASDTKYCCYLGDDDYLLPAEVQKGIDFLEANPNVVAYYAPCQLWDEVEQKSVFEAFYQPDGPQTFSHDPRGRVALWNFVHAHHVWPEHAIYRRSELDAILAKRSATAYWCFTDLANATTVGEVHFHDKPYYRNITQHPVGQRYKLGDAQCLTDFEVYRTGLELMAFDLFQGFPIPPESHRGINDMIRQFIWVRMEVAGRLYRAQGNMQMAEEMHKRCAVTALQV